MVTGGGTGLGKAIASEFARLGANIVIASRKAEHREAGEAAMTELGAPVLTVECDIRDADSIAAMFDAAVERFGLPRVLVNNAAANFPVPAEDMSPNAWRTVVDITLTGTFLCSREFARRHLAAGTPGVDHRRRRVVRVDRRTRVRALRGRQGRGEEPRGDARGRVGPVRHPGERARARASSRTPT